MESKKSKKSKKQRRAFTDAFRADVVRPCQAESESITNICRRLELL